MNTVTGHAITEPQQYYSCGDIFKINGAFYMLCAIGADGFCMVSLHNGNRWSEIVYRRVTSDCVPIDLVLKTLNGANNWEYIGPCHITVTPTK